MLNSGVRYDAMPIAAYALEFITAGPPESPPRDPEYA